MTRSFVRFLICVVLGAPLPLIADNHGSVRIYRLNSKDQLIKQRWVKHSELEGCHDIRGKKKVHRFAQVGFAWCSVYSDGDCKPGSEMAALWRGKKYRTADIDISQPQIELLPGANWYFDPEKNLLAGSWRCEY